MCGVFLNNFSNRYKLESLTEDSKFYFWLRGGIWIELMLGGSV
ncbi:hypothetical protein MEC_00978 [Bartonella alsatica IBS 382]|uniref:Uncharacterized protein n=1 Tax=Bartonella alsatica IBS 382 TaxID=1094551 RepID=J1IV88_9HYPH|nr:hypothetical protein MEC_00978 [Bartonella alsatica IBS 382]